MTYDKLIEIGANEIQEDVLERLDGLEFMKEADISEPKTSLFNIQTLNDWDWNDTNETTYLRIQELIKRCKNANWLMIFWEAI